MKKLINRKANHFGKEGFTLIELLVVIAIIGLLSTMAVIALGDARQKTRDAKRQADLKVLQTAIELYISDNGYEPAPNSDAGLADEANAWEGAAAADYSLEELLASYLPGGLPEDPGTRLWLYCNSSVATDNKYLVATSLEKNEAISGDIDTVAMWAADECIVSDGAVSAAVPVCADSNAGTVDTDTTATVVCLGSDDAVL